MVWSSDLVDKRLVDIYKIKKIRDILVPEDDLKKSARHHSKSVATDVILGRKNSLLKANSGFSFSNSLPKSRKFMLRNQNIEESRREMRENFDESSNEINSES